MNKYVKVKTDDDKDILYSSKRFSSNLNIMKHFRAQSSSTGGHIQEMQRRSVGQRRTEIIYLRPTTGKRQEKEGRNIVPFLRLAIKQFAFVQPYMCTWQKRI